MRGKSSREHGRADGHHQRAPHTLESARRYQEAQRWRRPTDRRPQRKNDQPHRPHRLAPDHIRHASSRQQYRRGCHQVGDGDPLDGAAQGHAEIARNRRQADVDDGAIEGRHEDADGDNHKHDPLVVLPEALVGRHGLAWRNWLARLCLERRRNHVLCRDGGSMAVVVVAPLLCFGNKYIQLIGFSVVLFHEVIPCCGRTGVWRSVIGSFIVITKDMQILLPLSLASTDSLR